jgi:glycosyltransferase involved in cell wall biosynthesis
MDKSLVSCLIPNYNKGRWLAECLWSLFSQTYRPIEVIICDNGSIDQSGDIIHVFKELPNFFSFYFPEPIGVAKAFNLCLSQAKGEYVLALGADDLIEPNHLEEIMKVVFANPDVDIFYGGITMIDEVGEVIKVYMEEKGMETIYDRCSVGHTTGVTKKSVYDEIGGYDENLEMSVDWEFILRALANNKKFLHTGRCGYRWRRFSGSDQLTMKNRGDSEIRKRTHSYIRWKYNLPGKCGCGCEATGMEGEWKISVQ